MNHPAACRCQYCAVNRRRAVIAGLERYYVSGHAIGPLALAYIYELEAEIHRLGGSTPNALAQVAPNDR